MFSKRFFLSVVAIFAFVCLSGCGGSSKPVSVAVTATATTVDGTDTVTLTATVSNDKNSGGVTWTVSGAGALSGNTTTSVTYTAPAATSSAQTATITATSVANTAKTGSVALTVPAAPSITTTSTNLAGAVGTAYSVTLAGAGGISPYTWSASGLPACLTMTTAGVVSGTVTASCAGTYTPTFKLTDSGTATALTATSKLNLLIAAATPISFTTSPTLTAGTYNSSYSASIVATGGAGSLTYTVTGGALPAGLAFANGAITGTPTAVGAYTITVSAADAYGDSASQTFSITVSYPAISITTSTTLPTGYAGAAYSQTLAATGGSGSGYTWTGSGLPAWLSLSTGGVLSATTPVAGTFSFAVTVTDSAKNTASATFSLTIGAGVSITTGTTLPTGYAGAAYSQTLAATGGSGTGYSWSSSNLPTGFALSTGGVLSATTPVAGTYSFTVTVTDSAKNTASATFSLTIGAGVSITTGTTLPTGYAGAAYSQTLAATGGSGTGYSWTGSSLPAWLSLSTGGVLTATTPVAGTFSFTATATDSAKNTASATFSLTINAALQITTTSPLSSGVVGTAYSQQLAATGGLGTYTWSLTGASDSADLAGLGLSFSTSGLLSGSTPITGGPVTFTAQVSDGTHTASASFSVTINASLAITTSALSPTWGMAGSSYTATLAATGGSGSYTWSVTTGASNVSALGLSLSSGGVLSSTSLVAGTANFTVTATDANNTSLKATQSYSITVYAALALTPNPNPLLSYTSGSSYNGTITVSGGSGSYASFQVNDGSGVQTVPSYQSGQLTLSSGFMLSMQHDYELIIGGTPSITTALSLTVTVTDSLSNVITHTYTLSPVASTMTVTLNDVPQGMVGMPYTYSGVSISGGTTPYTVTYTGAPDGLSKDTNNNLVGTPTSSGTTTVTVKVTDSSSTVQTVTNTFSLPVVVETVGNHDSYLKGQYACSLQKYWNGGVMGGDGTSTLYRGGMVFAIAVNGSGTITGGEIDSNSPYSGYKSASTLGSLSGTYAVGTDNRGYLLLTVGSSGSGVLALAGGYVNSSSQFSEFAITEMDDAGTDPSGQHGSGHCYKQDTTALSGIWPTGGYVFSLTGEDSSGEPEAIVGSAQYTAGTSSTTGTITGVMDMIDNVTTNSDGTLTGTTPSGTGTDAFGRTTMTAGPSTSEENTTVMYMTNNAKGQVLLMSTQAHNGSSDADFLLGEARKQVSADIAANYPLSGTGILYAEGTKDVSGSTPGYKAMAFQFTGSSSADTLTVNSSLINDAGTFKLDANSASGGVNGVTMTYTADTTTGRTTITGQTGIYFYLYDTNSAAILFTDTTKSGGGLNNLTGWIEPQTASGSWAIGDFTTSYFMYKIESGDYNNDSQTGVLTLDSSGNIGDYADDDGGWNWASWDESMTGNSGTAETGTLALDTTTNGTTTDGAYGLLDVNFTSGTTTTTQSYCFAISVDAATKSTAKGKLICLDASSNNPRLNIIQE